MAESPVSPVAVLAALLDRSLVQIADASADARRFDREVIRHAADVWDNNTAPFFRAATAGTPGERERRALAALEWMAALGAERRRSWMREQAAAAGHPLDGLLAPAKPYAPGRDHQGLVRPTLMAVTSETAPGLAADYDLPAAEIRYLSVERAGDRRGGRLDGRLELAVPRSYPLDAHTPPETATLGIRLHGITEVRFDSHDARGAALRPAAGGGPVSIGIGARGTLTAATADLYPDDHHWHRSAAGRRASAATPPRDSEPAPATAPQDGHLRVNAAAAAHVLHRAMLEIRIVRYAGEAGRAPVRELQRAFAGAGAAVLAAGAHRLPHRAETAFRRLIETWVRRGGPALAEWFDAALRASARQPHFLPGLLDEVRARRAFDASRRPAADPVPAAGRPREVELRMAAYTSAHTRYRARHDASALLHVAVPPRPGAAEDAPWYLRAVTGADPARFRLRTEAFQGSGPHRVTVDEDGARHFVLRGGALDVTTGKA